MSFILDALKKSENDRQRQSSPALFEVKVAAPRRQFPTWAVGVTVLLVLNAVVLAWILLRDRPAPTAAVPVAASPPASPTVAAASGEQQGMVTVTIPPTTVRIPMNSPAATAAEPAPGVVAPSQAPPLVEEPLLSDRETPIPPDYDSRDYQPAVTPAQAGVATARRSGLPSRDELLARGTSLPELRLDLHVFDDDPASRFVFINMRKLREGDSLPEGVRVEEITQTGARLSFRGTQFSLDGN